MAGIWQKLKRAVSRGAEAVVENRPFQVVGRGLRGDRLFIKPDDDIDIKESLLNDTVGKVAVGTLVFGGVAANAARGLNSSNEVSPFIDSEEIELQDEINVEIPDGIEPEPEDFDIPDTPRLGGIARDGSGGSGVIPENFKDGIVAVGNELFETTEMKARGRLKDRLKELQGDIFGSQGVSGGVSFGKNQFNALIPFLLLGAVAIQLIWRPIKFSTRKRR